MSNSGMAVELKYTPSKYVVSMITDEVINNSAKNKPTVKCTYSDEPDEELCNEGYVCIK